MSEEKKQMSRITKVTVIPEGEPLFSEMATEVEIVDEAGGEFIKVSQCHSRVGDDARGEICIAPEEWPTLKLAIDEMIRECVIKKEPDEAVDWG